MQNNATEGATVLQIHKDDLRIKTVYTALMTVLEGRTRGIPVLSVIGILEKIKMDILKDNFSDE